MTGQKEYPLPFAFCLYRLLPDLVRLIILEKCRFSLDCDLKGTVIYQNNSANAIGETASVYRHLWDIHSYQTMEELLAAHWEDIL